MPNYFKLKDSVFITDRAVAISEMEKDSIYIHGDTLMVTGKTNERIIKAFKRVKIFKSDLQGKCDSLVTNEKTGITKLFTRPIMWAEGNQITGDTIHFLSNLKTEQLDSLKILNNALMVKKDSAGFSQLKGKNMYGTFKNNSIESLDAIGNSETLFFLRDENDKLFGIDKKQSSYHILIIFENVDVKSIDYYKTITGKTYPPSEFEKLRDEDKVLPGFIWREDERPLTKDDIFIKDKTEAIVVPEKLINLKETPKIKDTTKIELPKKAIIKRQ